MKRKKTLEIGSKILYDNGIILISKERNKWFFEIGREVTNDVSEAVSILIRKVDSKDKIWEIELDEFDLNDIITENTLYWLSGGNKEWDTMENYTLPWCESCNIFNEKFGDIILDVISKSKTLGDIRKGFVKSLNLPTLYEFALSKYILK